MISASCRTLLPWLLVLTVGCSARDPEDIHPDLGTKDGAPAEEELPPGAVAVVGPFSLPARPHDERLDARFAVPPGFDRAEVDSKSFGDFLRGLPVRAVDAPLVDFHGWRLYRDGQTSGVAGVVPLPIENGYRPPCVEAILRLNAEWHYASGDRDLAYGAHDGSKLRYADYLAGERAWTTHGFLRRIRDEGPMADTHDALRRYLWEVIWEANLASFERDGDPVTFGKVRPGDYFAEAGTPTGSAVLVLDVAHDRGGRLALLLGQATDPGRGFQVLRAAADSAWFLLEPHARQIIAPFWTFPLTSLRRLP